MVYALGNRMEIFKYASFITTISIFTAFCSIIYQSYVASNELKRVTSVITGLMAQENLAQSKTGLKIAVGYGSSLCSYVRASFLYSEEPMTDTDVIEIKSEKDLLNSFAFAFKRGLTAERSIDRHLLKNLIQRARDRKNSHWSACGSALIIAERLVEDGVSVLLGAHMSKDLHKRLNPKIKFSQETFLEEDDTYLILEYQNDETWGKLRSLRANSYTLHSDIYNSPLNFYPKFSSMIENFNPRLLVISGEQVLKSKSHLYQIEAQLKNIPTSTLVHFKLPVEQIFLKQLLDLIVPYSDSLSMNEQSFSNLQRFYEIKSSSSSFQSNNLVTSTLDDLRTIFTILYDGSGERDTTRKVSRIHFNTQDFQIIVTDKSFGWRNAKQSIAKASLRAAKHVCGSEILNPGSFLLMVDSEFSSSHKPPIKKIVIKENDVVPCWTERLKTKRDVVVDVEFCVVPNLVCRNAIKTSGLDENVAATALLLQI